MSGFEIFTKEESALDALGSDSYAFGDIDMRMSDRDGSLVPVAVENGVHVCQQCRKQFVEDPTSPLRMVEFNCGGYGVRIGIHAKCVTRAQKAIERRGDRGGGLVFDMSLMHRARRFMAKAVAPFGRGDDR